MVDKLDFTDDHPVLDKTLGAVAGGIVALAGIYAAFMHPLLILGLLTVPLLLCVAESLSGDTRKVEHDLRHAPPVATKRTRRAKT